MWVALPTMSTWGEGSEGELTAPSLGERGSWLCPELARRPRQPLAGPPKCRRAVDGGEPDLPPPSLPRGGAAVPCYAISPPLLPRRRPLHYASAVLAAVRSASAVPYDSVRVGEREWGKCIFSVHIFSVLQAFLKFN